MLFFGTALFIFLERKKTLNKVSPRRRLFQRALTVFLALSVGVFGITAVNLARIQLLDSEQYKEQAEKNQLYDTEITAERGIIYDANGTVLAKSASVWKLYIKPNANSLKENEEFKKDLCRRVSEITGVEFESIKEKADKNGYAYLVIKRQIEFEEKEKIAALLNEYYEYDVFKKNDDGILEKQEQKI